MPKGDLLLCGKQKTFEIFESSEANLILSITSEYSRKSKFKKKNIFLILNYHSLQPFTGLIKIRFSFSVPRGFPACLVMLLSSLVRASQLEIYNVALLKSTRNFYGILCLQF